MDDNVIKATQASLGKIIKKPPLTDKLLNKPPFRFLHDVMTSVIKTSGFMKGLFTDTEMNSENVKDKDTKIAFLQKAIDIVSLVTGHTLAVKPTKVIAGHEPEQTNVFLQQLAAAVKMKVNNADYVQRVLNGDTKDTKKSEKSIEKVDKEKRDTSVDKHKDTEAEDSREPHKERDRSKDRSREGSRDDRHRDRDKDRHRGREKENRDGKDKSQERGKDIDENENVKKTKRGHREHSGSRAQEQDQKMDQLQQNGEMDGHDQDAPAPRRIERPASAKGARRRRDEEVVAQQLQKEHEKPEALGEDNLPPQVSEARRLARPSSARPAPPRVKKQETASEEPAMRLGSGRPTNVIVDNVQSDDDDDDNFMVEESTPQITEPDRVAETKQDGDEEGEHGGLVKKILETKKELEGGSQTAPQTQKRTEIERPTMNDATKRREREVVQKEINKLRTSIQTLTRSANPLGKVMDYVQEDLDAMQKELDRWKQENREHTLALKREQSITDKAVEPLKAQLNDVEQAIKDQLDLIAAVKSNCITNDQKIDKMLRSICRT